MIPPAGPMSRNGLERITAYGRFALVPGSTRTECVLLTGGAGLVRRRGRREVFAGEAGVAEGPWLGAHRLVHSLFGEVAERIRGDVLRDLLHGMRGRDQLLPDGRIDSVVAGPARRRRADAHVHFLGACIAQHLDDLAARGATHDRVVDHHHALALYDVLHRVELQLHAEVADRLRRLDERLTDVVAGDEPDVVRD